MQGGSSNWQSNAVLGTRVFKSGNHYWEITYDRGSFHMCGVGRPTVDPRGNTVFSTQGPSVALFYESSGRGSLGQECQGHGCRVRTGDIVGFSLVDTKTGTSTEPHFDLYLHVNRSPTGIKVYQNITGPVVACVELGTSSEACTLNSKAKKPK